MLGRKRRRRGVVVIEQDTDRPDEPAGPLSATLHCDDAGGAGAQKAALEGVWVWCKDNGATANKLWPGYSTSGRGLHATEDVQRGDLLLRVPAAVLFNTRSVHTDRVLGPVLREAAACGACQLNPLATLCFGLIHERALGVRSWWWPMLASFPDPSEMVTAEQFTAQELGYVPWAAALHDEHQLQSRNLSAASALINALLKWAICNEETIPALQAAQLRNQQNAYGVVGMSWAWSVVSTRACFMDLSKYQLSDTCTRFRCSTVSTPTAADRAAVAENVEGTAPGHAMQQLPAEHLLASIDTEDTSTLVPWLDLLNHTSAVRLLYPHSCSQ